MSEIKPVSEDLGLALQRIRSAFEPLIGLPIVRYQTAEILIDDGHWSPWPDLPIRIYAGESAVVSISWSCFDTLWLSNDLSLPFDTSFDTVRWVDNGVPEVNACLSRTIKGVSLGSSEVQFIPDLKVLLDPNSRGMQIWPNLMIHLDKGHLEVFNKLDANDFAFHPTQPDGTWLKCC